MSIVYNTSAINTGLVLCFDALNMKSYSPNVHPYPRDLYAWQSAANAATLSRDAADPSPAGGIPMRMDITGNDPYQVTTSTPVAPATSGQTWTISVWCKSTVSTTVDLYLFGIRTGDVYVEQTSITRAVTTGWTRISHTGTLNNNSTVAVGCRLDGTGVSGTGISIWWDGLQLERGSSVTTFNPTVNTSGTRFNDLCNQTSAITSIATTYNPAGYLTYNGSSSYTDFNAALGTTDVVTIEMLARFGGGGSTMPVGFLRYDVYLAYNTLGFNTASSDCYGIDSSIATSLGVYGSWNHYVFVMNKTLSYAWNSIYINGVQQSLAARSAGTESAPYRNFNSGSVRIAGWRNDANYRQTMDLSLFRIYDRQLSAAEIQQNFNAVRARVGL